jgi:benzodiazapine receptor
MPFIIHIPNTIESRFIHQVRVLNFIFFVFVVTIHILAVSGLNGITSRDILYLYPTFITPAGFSLSIWELIYFLLACFSIYQLIPSTYNMNVINDAVNLYFIFNSVFNVAWVFCLHWNLLYLSIFMMTGMLVTISIIYYKLCIILAPMESLKEWFLLRFGFSTYFGWLIVEAVISIYSTSTDLDPTYIDAGVVGIFITFIIEGYLAFNCQDAILAAVGSWALFAISSSHQDINRISNTAIVLGSLLAIESVAIICYHEYSLRRNTGRLRLF